MALNDVHFGLSPQARRYWQIAGFTLAVGVFALPLLVGVQMGLLGTKTWPFAVLWDAVRAGIWYGAFYIVYRAVDVIFGVRRRAAYNRQRALIKQQPRPIYQPLLLSESRHSAAYQPQSFAPPAYTGRPLAQPASAVPHPVAWRPGAPEPLLTQSPAPTWRAAAPSSRAAAPEDYWARHQVPTA